MAQTNPDRTELSNTALACCTSRLSPTVSKQKCYHSPEAAWTCGCANSNDPCMTMVLTCGKSCWHWCQCTISAQSWCGRDQEDITLLSCGKDFTSVDLSFWQLSQPAVACCHHSSDSPQKCKNYTAVATYQSWKSAGRWVRASCGKSAWSQMTHSVQ